VPADAEYRWRDPCLRDPMARPASASGRPPRIIWPASSSGGANGKLEIVLITGFPAGWLQCNCYVLAQHPGADAIVVDPGQSAMGQLRRILDKHRLTPAAVLLTHGHIDHIWSAQKVSDTFGCPAYIHPEDRFMLTDPIKGFGPRLGQLLMRAMFREPEQVIELDRDGDKIDLAGISVTVDHAPGHTRGSVVFKVRAATVRAGTAPPGDDAGRVAARGGAGQTVQGGGTPSCAAARGRAGQVITDDTDVVFTGDTLFERSVGRTDLFGGSGRDLMCSIVDKLLILDDKTVVLPGHGNSTTIGAERRANPFLAGLSS
jgi:hydroxyacylglutathione hydrolase